MKQQFSAEQFAVVAYEPGFHNPKLPTWTNSGPITGLFGNTPQAVIRKEIPEVPGAFQLLNVLSPQEADNLVAISEQLGYDEDSPVSLPHEVRHNENVNWVVGAEVDQTIWQRSKEQVTEVWQEQTPQGLNARFRFYKYKEGDFFETHTDGAWPGSRVINGELVANAYPGLVSQYTYLLFLSDGYEGGGTQFYVSRENPNEPAKYRDDMKLVNVYTPKGAALCFPHGTHPLHCLHRGEEIQHGTKYVIRTDILFG